jgi:hypothetical protein
MADQALCFLCLHTGLLPEGGVARFELSELDKATHDSGRHRVFDSNFALEIRYTDVVFDGNTVCSDNVTVISKEAVHWQQGGEIKCSSAKIYAVATQKYCYNRQAAAAAAAAQRMRHWLTFDHNVESVIFTRQSLALFFSSHQ